MWIENKYCYQCERCGGWGWQEAGCYNCDTRKYDAIAGVCRDCHGYGYLGMSDGPLTESAANKAARIFERNKEHNEQLGRDFTTKGN